MASETPTFAERSGFNGLLPYAAWVLALVSSAGSLFFSEVMGLPPCVLCWYQRIAMYPLVLIIGIGIAASDSRWKVYALPFALIGLAIAVYHNLIYYGIIPESLTPCSQGVSCSERQIELFGFITIPMMGLASFLAIAASIIFYKTEKKHE
ncbi:MAG TPA: disulfide bond formation protein B [Pyrinomonadaceae bacterium]|nr:disulfide bond formation protein B [Pyrinomonadaceae bacterium]